jgi:hypothetical protein
MAAVVAVAWAVVVAETEIQFDRRADVGGVASTIIRIVAGIGRPIHRASTEPGGQQQSGRASF